MLKKAFLLFLGLMFWLSGIFCQPIIDSMKSVLNSSDNTVEKKVELCAQIAGNYLRVNPDSAEYYAAKGLHISESNGYISGIFKNSCALGKVSLSQNQIDSAIVIFTGALKYFDELENKSDALCLFLLLGYANDMSQNYFEAHKYLYKGLAVAEEIRDSTFLWSYFNNLGNHYLEIDDHSKALEMFRKALVTYQMLDEDEKKFSLASVYNNMGLVYMQLNRYDSATYYLQKAISQPDVAGNYYGIFNLNINLGDVALSQGFPEKAMGYISNARTALDSLNKGFGGVPAPINAAYYNMMSKVSFELQKLQEATEYGLKALEYADLSGDFKARTEVFQRLAVISEILGDIPGAFNYQKLYIASRDSLEKRKTNQEIVKLTLAYEIEKERRQNQLEMELMNIQNRRKELIYIFAFITAGGIMISLFLLYRLQRIRTREKSIEEKALRLEKEKIAEDLEYKDKELATNVLYLLKKNELILSISKKLHTLVNELDEKNSATLSGIISDMSSNANKDIWEEFEVRFKEIHADFYNTLGQRYPDLTPNEFRLCAFLKLNMTNKEIAAITYQTPDSLRMARYRLRKKLKLSREENLVSFLAKI